MANRSDPAAVLAAARRWLGTPYAPGAAVRGLGCDCIGLARGIWGELTDRPAPDAPPWSPDWPTSWPRTLIALGTAHMIPRPPREAGPGDLVAIRRAGGLAAHAGILADAGRFIHATERSGVVEVSLSGWSGRIAWAASFPGAPS